MEENDFKQLERLACESSAMVLMFSTPIKDPADCDGEVDVKDTGIQFIILHNLLRSCR